MHVRLVPSHTGRTVGVIGISRDGGGLECWRRSALELDSLASSTVGGSMRELQVIDCLSGNESYELLEKKCLRLEWVTSIDPQDQDRCELAARHLQEDVRWQFTTTHASQLDPLAEGRHVVQGSDRARVAKSSALPMQIGAVKGNCV